MAKIERAWAESTNTAPYVWEAEKDGLAYAVEYPPGDAPETSFASIGFSFRARTGRQLEDVHTFVNGTPYTIRFRARPLRDGAVFPTVEKDVEPGDALVWTHRRVQTFAIMGTASLPVAFETMIFGRETAAGYVELAQVWPDGEIKGFTGPTAYRDAMNAL
jgi:hypothetical protein